MTVTSVPISTRDSAKSAVYIPAPPAKGGNSFDTKTTFNRNPF